MDSEASSHEKKPNLMFRKWPDQTIGNISDCKYR